MGRIAKTYTAAAVEAAVKKLSDMREKPKEEVGVTTNEAISTLKPAIKQMQQKGYSLSEILAAIRDSGIDIGMTTLKTAVAKPKRKAKVIKDAGQASRNPALVTKIQTARAPSSPARQDTDEK